MFQWIKFSRIIHALHQKFFIDESVEKPIVDWLRDQKYDVIYVAESSPAITDEEVIKIANSKSRILIVSHSPRLFSLFRFAEGTRGNFIFLYVIPVPFYVIPVPFFVIPAKAGIHPSSSSSLRG
jgi:hypothetical protein